MRTLTIEESHQVSAAYMDDVEIAFIILCSVVGLSIGANLAQQQEDAPYMMASGFLIGGLFSYCVGNIYKHCAA